MNAFTLLTCSLPALAFAAAATLALSGCEAIPPSLMSTTSQVTSGNVTGVNSPISGATIQLYAMESGGPSKPLLTKTVKSSSNGSFSISGLYTCPSTTAQTYLVVTDGTPEITDAVTNSRAALATLLGPCGSITTSAFEVNEVTTMASLSAMMNDVTSMEQMGSKSTTSELAEDYLGFTELVNPATGATPGLTVPEGYYVQTTKLNAMADILATCVNSKGGSVGDGSACGTLFTATTLYDTPVPTDTFMAARAMAMDWNLKLAPSLALAQDNPPFTPELTAAPTDWDLKLLPTTATPVISPASGTYATGTLVTITDATAGAVIHFTADGSEPTCSTPVYTHPFALASDAKVSASAIAGNVCSLFSPTSTYTIKLAASVKELSLSLSVPAASVTIAGSYQGTVTLSEAANVATVVSLSSSATGVITVSPASLTIPVGKASASFTYHAAGLGSATLKATAGGYTSSSVNVSSTGPSIPANYFGLTILNVNSPAPTVSYGTTRSWDVTSPGVDWADSNPAPGVYNWAGVDAWLAVNAGRGTDLIYTLGRTPLWASSNPTAPSTYGPGQCAPPANVANWNTFVTALAQHAAGRIKYWEMWNEPQDPQFYCGNIPTLVTLTENTNKLIKSVDPSAIIISPAPVSEAGATWLKTFLADGGGAYVDVIGFHGYGGATAESIITSLKYYQAAMAAEGESKLPLWDTEASWGQTNNAPSITNSADQASFLSKFYLLQYSQGVSRFVWYGWDAKTMWGQLWSSSGGINPAGVAYRQTYNWMVGATQLQPCSEDTSGDWSCTFYRSGGNVSMALWNSTKSIALKVPTEFIQYRDLLGNVHPIVNNSVTVGNSPILLEN